MHEEEPKELFDGDKDFTTDTINKSGTNHSKGNAVDVFKDTTNQETIEVDDESASSSETKTANDYSLYDESFPTYDSKTSGLRSTQSAEHQMEPKDEEKEENNTDDCSSIDEGSFPSYDPSGMMTKSSDVSQQFNEAKNIHAHNSDVHSQLSLPSAIATVESAEQTAYSAPHHGNASGSCNSSKTSSHLPGQFLQNNEKGCAWVLDLKDKRPTSCCEDDL